MPEQTYFPLHEDLTPEPNRIEPIVWIRHLFILGEQNVQSVVCEVLFERGRNIIRTEERGDPEEHGVARIFGKALLLRWTCYRQHFEVRRSNSYRSLSEQERRR
jgi:hypothetical protein